MINVKENIIIYAFHYAIGRSSNVVYDVVEHLELNWSNLDEQTKKKIHEEIDFCLFRTGNHGGAEFKALWMKVLNLPIR